MKPKENPQITREMKAKIFYAEWHKILYGDLTEYDDNNIEMMLQYAKQEARKAFDYAFEHFIDKTTRNFADDIFDEFVKQNK